MLYQVDTLIIVIGKHVNECYLPGEHAQESVNNLSCEGNSHLDPQGLKQCQEEAQHLVSHIYRERINTF